MTHAPVHHDQHISAVSEERKRHGNAVNVLREPIGRALARVLASAAAVSHGGKHEQKNRNEKPIEKDPSHSVQSRS